MCADLNWHVDGRNAKHMSRVLPAPHDVVRSRAFYQSHVVLDPCLGSKHFGRTRLEAEREQGCEIVSYSVVVSQLKVKEIHRVQ